MPHLSFLSNDPKFVLEIPHQIGINKMSLMALSTDSNNITGTESIHMKIRDLNNNEHIDVGRQFGSKYFHSFTLFQGNSFSYHKSHPYPWNYENDSEPIQIRHLNVELIKANGDPFTVAEWDSTMLHYQLYFE